jgi:hypothetical protein
MDTALNMKVTYEEFDKAIRMASTNTAPGFSGLTNNMIKYWPPALKTAVYEALSVLWEGRTTPEGWKVRLMCLKPKTEEAYPKPDDLRPLALLESLRKLWERILLKRMQKVWRQHHSMSSNQHFGPNRSTMDALLLLHNITEEASTTDQPLFMSSWDIKKAFDSVSKPLLIMSWVRMGVPPDMAKWIIDLDEGGATIIRTPLAQEQWSKYRHLPFNLIPTSLLPLFFSPERGVPQGGVLSPTNWTAFFDPLLVALADTEDENIHFQGLPGVMRPHKDPAFADDLNSASHRPDVMQRKADIVCAFALLMGLRIALHKLRTFTTSTAPPLPLSSST